MLCGLATKWHIAMTDYPDNRSRRRPMAPLNLAEVVVMPTYEFRCKKCGHQFTLVESISRHDQHKEKCPSCGSQSIDSLVSAAAVKTSKKS